jgi:hypothetical protein
LSERHNGDKAALGDDAGVFCSRAVSISLLHVTIRLRSRTPPSRSCYSAYKHTLGARPMALSKNWIKEVELHHCVLLMLSRKGEEYSCNVPCYIDLAALSIHAFCDRVERRKFAGGPSVWGSLERVVKSTPRVRCVYIQHCWTRKTDGPRHDRVHP